VKWANWWREYYRIYGELRRNQHKIKFTQLQITPWSFQLIIMTLLRHAKEKSKGVVTMELNRLADLMESSDAMQILHNQSPVWVETLNGSTATIKYLNSNQTARVQVAELVEADLPDLEDQYPTGLYSRISPIIRA